MTRAEAYSAARPPDERNKQVIFKNYAPFIDCISKINNMQSDNPKYLDVAMVMYYLIEYSDNYLKTFGSLQQCCRDEPNATVTDSHSFKFKVIIPGRTSSANTKDVELAVHYAYENIPKINIGQGDGYTTACLLDYTYFKKNY